MTTTLTTTLNRLKRANACRDRYAHLVRALGGVGYDHDAPINLLEILRHNGLDDCLWALRATEQDCESVARLIAADCAEAVLPIYEGEHPGDARPRAAIIVARAYARGEIDCSVLAAAWAAAREAARKVAGEAARAAAWAAAWAAAGAVARNAAREAAWNVAGEAARAAAGAAVRDAWASAAAAWAPAEDAVRDAWASAGAARAAAEDAQAAIIRGYLGGPDPPRSSPPGP